MVGVMKKPIAYFTMEIAIDDTIPSYSGGLGVLAGDIMMSFERLGIPCICVTLFYGKGYASEGNNNTIFDPSMKGLLKLKTDANVEIGNESYRLNAWQYRLGRHTEVLFIRAESDNNSLQYLSDFLYDPNESVRLKQEIVLGVGGVRVLKALGYSPSIYHMNESHSAFLLVELLRDMKEEEVAERCVMTTHTPIPAAHERFSLAKVQEEFQRYDWIDWKRYGKDDSINMSLFAASHCRAVNAVSMKHKYVSKAIFPEKELLHITNGINHLRWAHPAWCQVFDRYLPGWRDEPSLLRRALIIPNDVVKSAHSAAKEEMLVYIKEKTGIQLDANKITLGIARRVTGYKRNNLILKDVEMLKSIASGGMQLIFAGKAHVNDESAKSMIKDIKSKASTSNNLAIVFLDDYRLEIARLLVSGCDVWLNTPKPPLEASGTSGMKAALNGVLNMSVWDGWWLEGGIEGVNGWGIGERKDWEDLSSSDDETDYRDMVSKLSNVVIPLFYNDENRWINMMKSSIASIPPYFNTDRVAKEYIAKMYFTL